MATVTHFLDTRKSIDENGIIKLRITHNRVQRDYSTKIKISPKDYSTLKKWGAERDGRKKEKDLIHFHNLLYASKDVNNNIYEDGFVVRAKTIIKQLGVNFSFDKFKAMYDAYGVDVEIKTDVISFLNKKCEMLRAKGQISHGNNFGLVAKSLTRFVDYLKQEYPEKLTGYRRNKEFTLEFKHVTSTFLQDWQDWLLVEGKTPKKATGTPTGATETTVGIYSRTLRVVFNDAISENIIEVDKYPFGKRGFVIPVGANVKKALSNNQLESIKAYKPEPFTIEERSHDLWLFSYFGNGMNFNDILHLKWENIKETGIYFERRKTMKKNKSKSNDAYIHVRINERMKDIIERLGVKSTNMNDFVFPFLKASDTSERKKAIVHQVIKVTNLHMNKIAEKLGIKEKLNTYEARHSFASRLMRSNAPLMMISQKLGHAKVSTTESYLGSFEKETEDAYLDTL